MKILISSGIFPPDIGGPANFVPRIAEWLVQRGHDVHVVCWSDTDAHNDHITYSFKVHRILRQGSRFNRMMQTVWRLYQLGKSADIIFANNLALEVRLAGILLGKPEVHKVVGDRAWEVARLRHWFSNTLDAYQQSRKTLRLQALDKLRNFSLARAQCIIAPSYYLATIIDGWKLPVGSAKVIYNSTQLDQSADSLELPAYAGKTITTICRLVSWKGVNRLITPLNRLQDVRLVIAGDGPDRQQLQELVEENNLADRVLFLGQISKPQVRALLEASDIFVLNSAYEGLPHVVLEAMAAGVPVIATDVGGTGEVIKHNETGVLIPYGNDEVLLHSLRCLLESPDDCNRLVTVARKLIQEKFDEEVCFAAYEKLLLETISARRSQAISTQVSAL